MSAVNKVLVIGAGMAGAAVAIRLAEVGIEVEVVEVKDDVTAIGSGITLMGNALRALDILGIYQDCLREGYAFDDLGIRAPDENATVLVVMEDAKYGGPDYPATMGMFRPELARIMVQRAEALGAGVRFGTSVTSMTQDGDGVDVTFADGTAGRYDLVVGCDGIKSPTRTMLGIELETTSVGMGIWRIFSTRPAEVTRTDLIYGGTCYIAGYCPTGEESMYAYLVEDARPHDEVSAEDSVEHVRSLAAPYHGPWDEIKQSINSPDQLNYTWFEAHVLDGPWNRDRVVLIGDAAHTCPPTLAQGGAQALEDALVLTEMLIARDDLDEAFWSDFTDRRLPRAAEVVQLSTQITTWLKAHEHGDIPGVFARAAELLIPVP